MLTYFWRRVPVKLNHISVMCYTVDLRSDTVTKPTESMKHAMVNAEVGDDVFGEDPTINTLQSNVAKLLGKETALFVPTATMANLIAVMVHCNRRGSEALVGNLSHIYRSELGGASHAGGVLLSTLDTKSDGTHDLDEVEKRIRDSSIYQPVTSLVAVENTHNYCGGKVLPMKWLDELGELCRKHSLPLHMDGARLLNASARLQLPAERVVRDCDSVTLCFSKGLSAPAGAALSGSYHFIEQARRMRKMLGGGMRQAGVLAAAALVGLAEVAPELPRDHKRANVLAKTIESMHLKYFTVDVEGTHTNIVIVRIAENSCIGARHVLERLIQVCPAETHGGCETRDGDGVKVKAISFNAKTLRFTLHRDISDEDLRLAIAKMMLVFREMEAAHAG